MLAQALAAEVDTLPAALAEFALERIRIRTFEGDAILPQRGLRGPDLRRAFVARNVITGLGDEPWQIPAA